MTLEALLQQGTDVVRARGGLVLEVCSGDPQQWGQDRVWLALAVLTGQLPLDEEVVRTRRALQLDGPEVALGPVLAGVVGDEPVRTVSGDLVVAPETALGRALAGHWPGTPVTWDGADLRAGDGVRVIPWQARLVLAEPVLDLARATRLRALLQQSGSRGSAVDLGCGALVTGDPAHAGALATWLGTLAHVQRVATPSEAAAEQLAGWREMLAGTGLAGPEVRAFPLAGFAPPPGPGSAGVVCTDSRALHVLHDLREQGLRFDLATDLGRGARLLVHAAVDDTLAAPVQQALAAGIPVVTSSFGAMREIGLGGGALLVDPRDDEALTEAVRSVLTDDALHRALSEQAAARTWPECGVVAQEVWDYLVTDA